MQENTDRTTPESAAEWYDSGVSLRQQARFGEAVNAFRKAAELAVIEEDRGDLPSDEAMLIVSRAEASVELIREINSFVNADLMNP